MPLPIQLFPYMMIIYLNLSFVVAGVLSSVIGSGDDLFTIASRSDSEPTAAERSNLSTGRHNQLFEHAIVEIVSLSFVLESSIKLPS